ncbi:MAG TPA: amylo-alpha-1,6-glucosidase [Candidatus Nanoarchaeia archaeon]|nr:amylo-alpha-1,6-glucosidase [Candidatus Nanoarchaeia archaeon]
MISTSFLGKKITSDASKILLTNNIGSFFFFSPVPFSKYSGLFIREEDKIFKCIEEIKQNNRELKQTEYSPQSFTNLYGSEKENEKFSFSLGKNALLYETNSGKEVTIVLDCRKVDDYSNWGRYYEVTKEKDLIVIKYKKVKDSREQSQDEYEFYTVLKADSADFSLINSWEERFYSFDSFRNDSCNRYVYNCISLTSKKIGFGFSLDKSKAIALAYEAYKKSTSLNFSPKEIPKNNKVKIKDSRIEYCYELSRRALSSLEVNTKNSGIYAGLPWFHQFWTRDTALSAKAFLSINEIDFVKEILLKMLSSAKEDGLIPNRLPHSDLNSIDGSGLVVSRIKDMLSSLSKQDKKQVQERIKRIALNILTFHSKDQLIVSKPYESWMDTDLRSGALIEIQALQLSMYKTLRELSNELKDKKASTLFLNLEKELKKIVLDNFYVNEDLIDCIGSKARRPNVFLAYYFYPELLSSAQWSKVFDKHLDCLYLEWGALSTIDVKNKYFQASHSGTTNTSYHKGDSWFFINNLAAICLARVDRRKYGRYINRILDASTIDILDKGIFGFHSELSSASHQEANGCLAQLWSSAMYVELIEELFGK